MEKLLEAVGRLAESKRKLSNVRTAVIQAKGEEALKLSREVEAAEAERSRAEYEVIFTADEARREVQRDAFALVERQWNLKHDELYAAVKARGAMAVGKTSGAEAFLAQEELIGSLTNQIDELAHRLDALRDGGRHE